MFLKVNQNIAFRGNQTAQVQDTTVTNPVDNSNVAPDSTDKEKSHAMEWAMGATALAAIVVGILGHNGKLGKGVQKILGGAQKDAKEGEPVANILNGETKEVASTTENNININKQQIENIGKKYSINCDDSDPNKLWNNENQFIEGQSYIKSEEDFDKIISGYQGIKGKENNTTINGLATSIKNFKQIIKSRLNELSTDQEWINLLKIRKELITSNDNSPAQMFRWQIFNGLMSKKFKGFDTEYIYGLKKQDAINLLKSKTSESFNEIMLKRDTHKINSLEYYSPSQDLHNIVSSGSNVNVIKGYIELLRKLQKRVITLEKLKDEYKKAVTECNK